MSKITRLEFMSHYWWEMRKIIATVQKKLPNEATPYEMITIARRVHDEHFDYIQGKDWE